MIALRSPSSVSESCVLDWKAPWLNSKPNAKYPCPYFSRRRQPNRQSWPIRICPLCAQTTKKHGAWLFVIDQVHQILSHERGS